MNGTRRLLATSLTGLFATSEAYAQAHQQGGIDERFSTSTPVSGVRIVGLTSGTFERPIGPSHIKLLLLGTGAQRICFFAVTHDSSYDARGILVVPSDAKGFAAIEQRSRYGRQLSSNSGTNFAVRAAIGVSCANEMVPTLIGAGDGTPPRSLRFLKHRHALATSSRLLGSAHRSVRRQTPEAERAYPCLACESTMAAPPSWPVR